MHRLALALGMTVADIRRTMSAAELADWLAYFQIEPFGEDRADLRAGIIASTIANVNRTKKTRPFQPRDFMPFAPKPTQQQALDSKIMDALDALNARNSARKAS